MHSNNKCISEAQIRVIGKSHIKVIFIRIVFDEINQIL